MSPPFLHLLARQCKWPECSEMALIQQNEYKIIDSACSYVTKATHIKKSDKAALQSSCAGLAVPVPSKANGLICALKDKS